MEIESNGQIAFSDAGENEEYKKHLIEDLKIPEDKIFSY